MAAAVIDELWQPTVDLAGVGTAAVLGLATATFEARPSKEGHREGATKVLDGEEGKNEEDKMIGRGMAPSSMHPDNEFHPDNHKTPAAYPLRYTWRGIDVEAAEKAEAEAAGRPYDFMRPEVNPAWVPGLTKKKPAPTSVNQIRLPKRASSDRRLRKIKLNVMESRQRGKRISDDSVRSKPHKSFKQRKADGEVSTARIRSNPRAASADNVHNQLSSRNYQREGAMSVQDVRLTSLKEEGLGLETVDDIDARKSQDDGETWDRMRREMPDTPAPPPPPPARVTRSPRDRAPPKARISRKDTAAVELQEREMFANFQLQLAKSESKRRWSA